MLNRPITISQLKKFCEEQIINGNGNKSIMISSDDEGNNYHYLWFAFTTIEEYEKPIEYNGVKIQCDFEWCDQKEKDKIIILG